MPAAGRPRAGRRVSKFQIVVVVVRIVVARIDYNPRRSPGPWFLAERLEASIRPRATPTLPRCAMISSFSSAQLSAGLGAYPPYCPHRFLCSGAPTSRIAHHVVGERFGASRNVVLPRFLGAPPRPTPRAVRNSLGLPMGAFRLRTS